MQDVLSTRMFVYKETLRLRRFADVFAFANYATYKELVYFERFFVKEMLTAFSDFSEASRASLVVDDSLWLDLINSLGHLSSLLSTGEI